MQCKTFFYIYSHKIFFWLFIVFFALQAWFWHKTESYHKTPQPIPETPSKYVVSAMSFGDKEFLFRALATRIQNAGDIFAGFMALKYYDYKNLYQWLKTLDNLNNQSLLMPSLTSHYYSQTQKKADNIYIVNYLDEFASKDIDKYWWWLFQATFIAKRDLKNYDLSLKIANKLAQNQAKTAPLWTKQMPAFISAEMGNNCLALNIISHILQDYEKQNNTKENSQEIVKEINFMKFFIEKQIHLLKQQNFNAKQCP